MLVNVQFGNSVNGAWIDLNDGTVCLYADKHPGPTIVIGHYPDMKEDAAMDNALIFNENKEVLLQRYCGPELGFTFTKLNPEKVAARLEEFLANLYRCAE